MGRKRGGRAEGWQEEGVRRSAGEMGQGRGWKGRRGGMAKGSRRHSRNC